MEEQIGVKVKIENAVDRKCKWLQKWQRPVANGATVAAPAQQL